MRINMSVKGGTKDLGKLLKQATPKALAILGEQVRNDSDQFVPRLTGDLRTYVDIKTGKNEVAVVYNTPYAKYQWFGYNFHHTTTNTYAEWCEVARSRYGKDWTLVLANAITERIK